MAGRTALDRSVGRYLRCEGRLRGESRTGSGIASCDSGGKKEKVSPEGLLAQGGTPMHTERRACGPARTLQALPPSLHPIQLLLILSNPCPKCGDPLFN